MTDNIDDDDENTSILAEIAASLNYSNSDHLLPCGPSTLSLLQTTIANLPTNPSKSIHQTSSLISLANDKFYAYPYKDVPRCWRRLYVEASLVQAIARIRRDDEVGDVVRVIDMALIMAGGEGRHKELNRLLEKIELQLRTKRQKIDVPEEFAIQFPERTISNPIKRLSSLSLSSFQNHMNSQHTPLILTNCLTHWPALQNWRSPQYWLSKTLNGTRLIPIELGESYTSQSWSQTLLPFSSFLHQHLLTSSDPKGYLAQHDLLSQIPLLRSDILIPDYCYTDPPPDPPDKPLVEYKGGDVEVLMNIWMGGERTKSPLHTDPYENVFAQVVGGKYFRLYPPKETNNLYPRGIEGGIEMGNTSEVQSTLLKVDVENPGEDFPRFAKAEYVEGILGPGECLYIPRGWWHFVRSESVSIGVSFWW